MTAITKGWPPKRRKEQAARIKRQKPWRHATGPRSQAGKSKIRRNAYKHGFRSRDYDEICRLLRWQKAFMKNILIEDVQKFNNSLRNPGRKVYNSQSHKIDLQNPEQQNSCVETAKPKPWPH